MYKALRVAQFPKNCMVNFSGRPVQSNIIWTSLGSIQPHCNYWWRKFF